MPRGFAARPPDHRWSSRPRRDVIVAVHLPLWWARGSRAVSGVARDDPSIGEGMCG